MYRRSRAVVSIVILVEVVIYLLLAGYVASGVNYDNSESAGAILVLGAKSYRNDNYNPCLKARVDHAVDLYDQGLAPMLLMSGGTDQEDGANEAATMRQIAVELGVSSDKIMLEDQASSTYENLLYSREVLEKNQIESVVLVTEGFHIKRAHLVAQALGLNHTVSPVNTSPCWLRWKYLSRYFLREPLVIVYYGMKGYIF